MDLNNYDWRKSTRSGDGGTCIEVAVAEKAGA